MKVSELKRQLKYLDDDMELSFDLPISNGIWKTEVSLKIYTIYEYGDEGSISFEPIDVGFRQ